MIYEWLNEWNREFSRIVNRVGPGFKCGCIRSVVGIRYVRPCPWYPAGTAMGIAHRGMHGAVPTVCSRF
jgi:hypothetical protein